MLFNTQSNKWKSNSDWPIEQTPGEMLTDLAANKADIRKMLRML